MIKVKVLYKSPRTGIWEEDVVDMSECFAISNLQVITIHAKPYAADVLLNLGEQDWRVMTGTQDGLPFGFEKAK